MQPAVCGHFSHGEPRAMQSAYLQKGENQLHSGFKVSVVASNAKCKGSLSALELEGKI